MNKADIEKRFADKLGSTKKDVQGLVDDVTGIIVEALAAGEKVSITGFGTFKVKETKARNGRNPKTGETLQIPAKKKIVFVAAKELKAKVEGGE